MVFIQDVDFSFLLGQIESQVLNVVLELRQVKDQFFLFLGLLYDELDLLLVDRDVYLQQPFNSVGGVPDITERHLTLVSHAQLVPQILGYLLPGFLLQVRASESDYGVNKYLDLVMLKL